MKSKKEEIDYHKVVVRKPWGFEYLMFENGTVGVWFLRLTKGAKTSMHCHPNKKTGLIVLEGEAELSFLNDSTTLKPISKMMIREGLFHSTRAVSEGGIVMIEVETPCDKSNLVRLDDEYGREEKPYEGREHYSPITAEHLQLPKPDHEKIQKFNLAGAALSLELVKDVAQFRERPAGELIIVLDGGLFSKGGEPVLNPGDVISSDTAHRLAERFFCPKGASLLTLRKEA